MSQSVNLYNSQLLPPPPLLTLGRVGWITVLIVVLGVIGFVYLALQQHHLDARLKIERRQLLEKQNLLAMREQALSPEKAIKKELAEARLQLSRQKRLDAIIHDARLGDRRGYSRYLLAIANRSLPGVWLTRIDIEAENNGLDLEGYALNARLVPEYIDSLKSEKALQGKKFSTLEVSADTYHHKPVVEFRLHSTLKGTK
ncbi:MAG: PilN domain-containing protein [Pseudomonadota bacterium]|nr:PilN domain-containing protein [Pseudomonadota bacterium]